MRLLLLALSLTWLSPLAFSQSTDVSKLCKDLASTSPSETLAGPLPAIDVALAHWNSKSKFFIVATATKTALPSANLDFAKVNADFVASKLQERGYVPLSEPLTGERATRDNLVEAIHKINQVPDNGLVVVYYTGHGVKSDDNSELWLQLFGNVLGPGHGLSVSQLISDARGSYAGELIIIIDSCFSGHGTLNTLTGKALDKTTIVTSSSEIQTSRILTLEDGSQASAFTFYLTEALTTGWSQADFDSDGILEYSELIKYLRLKLNCAKLENKIDGPMTPKPFLFSDEQFFAYDQTKVKNWNSPIRQVLASEMLLAELKNGDAGTAEPTDSPESATSSTAMLDLNKVAGFPTAASQAMPGAGPVSERALALASLIKDDTDPYRLALKLIAEGRANEAEFLLKELTQQDSGNLEKLFLALGLAQRYSGKNEDAIETYKRGLALNNRNKDLLDETAHTLSLETKYKESKKFFEKSITVKTKTFGSRHPYLADTLEKYAALLRKMNNTKKAAIIFAQATMIRSMSRSL